MTDVHALQDANEVKAEEGASSQNESLKGSNAPHTEKADDEESLISPPLDAREKAAENDSSDSVPMSAKLAMEFTGTYFLCLTVGLSAALSTLAPIAIGGILMCFVYAGAHVSGANYNPAVSVALALRGALPWNHALLYVLAQLSASVVAGCTCLLIMLNDVQRKEGGSGAAAIGHPSVDTERFSLFSAFVAEVVYTFALCFVVLSVATVSKAEGTAGGNQFFGLAIGFTVTAGACSGGPISGGAFNPAVGFGLPLCAGEFQFIPLYVFGPLLGAALASFLFYLTNFKEFQKDE